MAKVNLYISNDAYEKINAIIEKRRQEGAREKDVSFSATASMLWICPYISRHLLSLNPLLACCRRYSRGER